MVSTNTFLENIGTPHYIRLMLACVNHFENKISSSNLKLFEFFVWERIYTPI